MKQLFVEDENLNSSFFFNLLMLQSSLQKLFELFSLILNFPNSLSVSVSLSLSVSLCLSRCLSVCLSVYLSLPPPPTFSLAHTLGEAISFKIALKAT